MSLVALLLGFMLSAQYKLITENYLGGMLPITKLNQMKSELESLYQEKETLSSKINDLQEKLDQMAFEEASDNIAISTLREELTKYKMLAGFTNLQGEGIAIYLDNEPNEDGAENLDIVQDYNLILFLVNELSASGAEAISINDQRYTAGSEIRGTTDYVTVNGFSLKPPFVIKAIGNKEVLATAVEQRFGIVEIIRKRGYFCEVNKLNDLRIVGSNKIIDWKYAKPKKDKE